MIKIILSIVVCLSCFNVYAIPSFPGAEGFGADTIGGREGAILKVTNLNDSGAGSFRAAVTASGARIVIFEVSGIIHLESSLAINNPYLTIAGESSPGGICVSDWGVSLSTYEVIIRHMRFRVGIGGLVYDVDGSDEIIYYDQPQYNFPPTGPGGTCLGGVTTEALGYPCVISGGADPETLRSFIINGDYWANPAYDIILDHCSFTWGVDETLAITGGVTDLTVQWCIVAEPLNRSGHPEGQHGNGLYFDGKYTYPSEGSIHHNYIAHCYDRPPWIYSPETTGGTMTADFVNNVVYNWYGGTSPRSGGIAKTNFVHNYCKQGDSSNSYSYEVSHNYLVTPIIEQIYVLGNIGSTRLLQTDPEWNVGKEWRDELLDDDYQSATPWTVPAVGTSTMSLSYANETLEDVGATKPFRDDVDARLVADFAPGTGDIVYSITIPDDYPTYPTPSYPTDTDNDGMADSWETENGLNVGSNDSAGYDSGTGYTNIEDYLHTLAATVIGVVINGDFQ